MNRPERIRNPTMATAADTEALLTHYQSVPLGLRANMIYSADGAPAVAGRVQGLTCPADQTLLNHLRSCADVILVGAATARAERYGPVRLTDRQLRERHASGLREIPRIAVVSRSGNLPSSIYESPPAPLLITSAEAAVRHELVSDSHRDVVIAGDQQVDVGAAVTELRNRGLHRILCEGGPTLLDEIIRADLVDEICVTIAPRLAGSQAVGSSPPLPLEFPLDMDLLHAVVHANYVFLRYARRSFDQSRDV